MVSWPKTESPTSWEHEIKQHYLGWTNLTKCSIRIGKLRRKQMASPQVYYNSKSGLKLLQMVNSCVLSSMAIWNWSLKASKLPFSHMVCRNMCRTIDWVFCAVGRNDLTIKSISVWFSIYKYLSKNLSMFEANCFEYFHSKLPPNWVQPRCIKLWIKQCYRLRRKVRT